MTQGEGPRARLPAWARKRLEVNVYKLKQFVESAAAQVPAGARVLDAGAGQGRFRSHFQHTRYVGVDLGVGDASWNYSGLSAIADLSRLPFCEACFDAILCTQVLEHVPEPGRVVGEIARVLRPGGRLYLSAPQSWHEHQKPHDYYRFTSFGLRYLTESNGLAVECIKPLGGYFWFLSFQLQNLNYWVFSQGRRRSAITWPLRALLGVIFQLFLPLILFYLDGLDHAQDETFGHVCIARKPAIEICR